MTSTMLLGESEQIKEALIDAVSSTGRTQYRGLPPEDTERLLRLYYHGVAPQDLEEGDPKDLYASAVRHWELARFRKTGNALVRVANPKMDQDGWTSRHTSIDIVTDDSPFLVDSILALLETLDIHVHLLAHPIFCVDRLATGEVRNLSDPHGAPAQDHHESFIHLEVDRAATQSDLDELRDRIVETLDNVKAAVQDWHPMRDRALAIADELQAWADEKEPRFEATVGDTPTEVSALLRWMESGSFTFMGYREYSYVDNGSATDSSIVSRPETGLGTLRQVESTARNFIDLPRATGETARRNHILNLTKANTDSTVHRAVPLDYIGIKELDRDGNVTGERRFIGLFTSNVYSGRVEDIPVVRDKVSELIQRADFTQGSHDRSRLLNVLQTYPRDELFQADIDCLQEMVMSVLNLRDRRKVSLMQRADNFGRFLSCLVFVPRDRHNTDVRLAIQNILMEAYQGTHCRFSTEISNAPLARLHLVIYTDPAAADSLPELGAVQSRLSRVITSWDDDLRHSLLDTHGEVLGLTQFSRYRHAFSAGYRDSVSAGSAVNDINRLENLKSGAVDVRLSPSLDGNDTEMRCKLYCDDKAVTLTQFIPLLHDLGAVVIDERPHAVQVRGEQTRHIYDIGIELPHSLDTNAQEQFRQGILAVWNGRAESDGYAKLIATAELGWRDVVVLRAYARYLVQIGSPFSPSYVMDTLNQNPHTAARLVQLFRARFDPASNNEEDAERLTDELDEAIDRVISLDADRILRSFRSLILATRRTNHWQTARQGDRAALALKLEPSDIPDIPRPVPLAEIFVYSPRTEGVHLRSARVARGGLRWSDRMEDFRTEILGLMKAQSVKNSVIVPAGAKGGFVAKQLPRAADRDTTMAEVVACYETFIGALLDVTDNLIDGVVVPPIDVVRHDDDDPYLVVAADKGTATFSDIANGIAEDRGFWLGDAFASGGSVGYDHKALAITARGAWISVRRHFRELGIDVDTDTFTAVGIGDMSGDVFGNGMLRTTAIELVAAFDHRDIFIDPTPNAHASFTERQRLFELPRSSWADYNTDLLSEGGGVFSRSAKSIPVTPQIVSVLGLDAETTEITPNALMKAILLAPVDLLWNGGIGTYAKASAENHNDAGDRNNDAIRVDGSMLRCRVVGEGGNLGFTQAARVEFANRGGRINTDAIDNSAGVDCSDHEVNLKILMSQAELDGDITRKQRNQLLESMSTDICEAVLDNNYLQTGALTIASSQASGMAEVHERLMLWLSERAGLDRDLEGLPSTAELAERHENGSGLTRPELSVLLAYTKNLLTDELAHSDLPQDSQFDNTILHYFPQAVADRFPTRSINHPLRTELVSTLVANDLINRSGITMVHRLIGETSATVSDIARAHIAAWEIYDLAPLFASINSLDNEVPAEVQTILVQEIKRLGERATRWLLRNEPHPLDIAAAIEKYQEPVRELDSLLADEETFELAQAFQDTGVPEQVAHNIAMLGKAFGSLDLSNVARRTESDLEQVAAIHACIDQRLELHWLRTRIIGLPRDDHWQTLARSALRDEFFSEHAEVTAAITTWSERVKDDSASHQVEQWMSAKATAVRRCRVTFGDIEQAGDHDLARVSVALRALRQLSRSQ